MQEVKKVVGVARHRFVTELMRWFDYCGIALDKKQMEELQTLLQTLESTQNKAFSKTQS